MQLSFEVTEDPVVLNRYYKIREYCFRKDLGLEDFDGGEDIFDCAGVVLAFFDGDLCIGGVRLNGDSRRLDKNPGLMLPVEHAFSDRRSRFSLQSELSDIIEDAAYCQWSRLVIMPEYRNRVNLALLLEKMITVARLYEFGFSFYVSGLTQARLYKRYHEKLGYAYYSLSGFDLPVEEGFETLPHVLSVSRIDSKGADIDITDYLACGAVAEVA
jgi:hypothetical protein